MVKSSLIGLTGFIVGGAILGASILPNNSYGKPEKIYDRTFGSTRVAAELDKDEKTLELKILPENYGERRKNISHPNIYMVHPKGTRFETEEEGFLSPPFPKKWYDLKEKRKSAAFFREIVETAFSSIPFNIFSLEDLIKFADGHDQTCKDFAKDIVSESGQEYSYGEVVKYSEGINMSAIKYKFSFEKKDVGKVHVLGGINSPKACFGFNFILGGKNKPKENRHAEINAVQKNTWITSEEYFWEKFNLTDGKILVNLTPDKEDILVCDLVGRERKILRKTADIAESIPSLSPDGRRIAFWGSRLVNNQNRHALYVSDLNGNYREIAEIRDPKIIPVWDDDESLIFYAINTSREPDNPRGLVLYRININSKRWEKIGDESGIMADGGRILKALDKSSEEQRKWCFGS